MMSQEKVDKRKQSKGEALHFAHKKVVMLSWIIVLLVVVEELVVPSFLVDQGI